jgi:thiamine-phosphate pyrophosphorylase
MSRALTTPESLSVEAERITGLYAVTPDDPDTETMARKVRQALAGGADVVQYRNKSAKAALRRAQATTLLGLCRTAGVPLVINDDLELALSIGADGVHLGQNDADLTTARARLGKKRLLGASCYDRLDLALVARERGADYVAFGSAFPSSTKPAAVRAPLALYGAAKARIDLPVVAIGGITHQNAREVIAAGADAVAVISALFDAPDVMAAALGFRECFRERAR